MRKKLLIVILSVTMLALVACEKKEVAVNGEKETSSKSSDYSVSKDVPEIVKKYVAPTEMGNSLSDFIVEYDGALYKLPFPVSELVKNGWEIKEGYSDSIIYANGDGHVKMTKNGESEQFYVLNCTDKRTGVENCFIKELRTLSFTSSVDMKLPKGIYTGMSEADFLKAIEGERDVKSFVSGKYTYYTFDFPDSTSNFIQVSINNESKTAEDFSVYYAEDIKEALLK
jgi:hypothetical protein